jgi:hypothetical protein
VTVNDVFDGHVALVANPEMRPDCAGDFAAVLRDAAEMTAEAELHTRQAIGADRVTPAAPVAPIAPDEDRPPPRVGLDRIMEPDDDPVIDCQIDATCRSRWRFTMLLPRRSRRGPPPPAAWVLKVLWDSSRSPDLRNRRAGERSRGKRRSSFRRAPPAPPPAPPAKKAERAPTPAPSAPLPAPAPSRPARARDGVRKPQPADRITPRCRRGGERGAEENPLARAIWRPIVYHSVARRLRV